MNSSPPSPQPSVLLIGPKSIRDETGGTIVSFEALVAAFGQSGRCRFQVVSTTRQRRNLSWPRRTWNATFAFLRIVLNVARSIRRHDVVMLNIAPSSLTVLGTCIWLLCKVARKPMFVRIFGGNFEDVYDGFGPIARRLADRTYLNVRGLLLQTNELVARFSSCPGVRWFPTTREMPVQPSRPNRPCRKLIFISQLFPTKGWVEALAALDHLPPDCTLDVYGPLVADTDLSAFKKHSNAQYHGAIQTEHVPRILAEHDLLVFPTYYFGEGYPGIIIEAFQCGLPVVATQWKAIPELVIDGTNGLLIPPRAVTPLVQAIRKLIDDPALYHRLTDGAMQRGEEFRTSRLQSRLERWLREAINDSVAA